MLSASRKVGSVHAELPGAVRPARFKCAEHICSGSSCHGWARPSGAAGPAVCCPDASGPGGCTTGSACTAHCPGTARQRGAAAAASAGAAGRSRQCSWRHSSTGAGLSQLGRHRCPPPNIVPDPENMPCRVKGIHGRICPGSQSCRAEDLAENGSQTCIAACHTTGDAQK